jgi:predicted DNA-binding transcriptional regulator YafY
VDLRRTDADEIGFVKGVIESACIERRRLEFLYGSPSQDDQQPRRHEVEPYELIYRRKHYYLRGFCLYTDGPKGKRIQERVMYYRLGRIAPDSIKILPQTVPLAPRRTPKYPVRYELKSEIARKGVTHHFDDTAVEMREDGSALVQGYTDDVFWASRELLYYGAGCRVLGGLEILREMRKLVEEMAKVYKLVPER